MANGWTERIRPVANKARASWPAVVIAGISLLVQGVNFVKTDLKPLMDAARSNTAALERIERRLEDHERRLVELEAQQKVFRRQK